MTSQNRFIFSVILIFLGMFCIPIMRLHPQVPTVLWLCFFMCNVHIFRNALSRSWGAYNCLVVLFCIVVCLSWIQSRDYLNLYADSMSVASSFVRVVFRCFSLLLTSFFIEDVYKTKRSKLFFRVLYKCFFFYVLIIDMQALTLSRSVILEQTFFAGNKFDLCYSNIYLMMLFCLKTEHWGKNERWMLIGLTIICFFVAFFSECSTAILGVSLFLVLLKFKSFRLMNLLCNPVFFLSVLIFCTFNLILFSSIVLNIGFVRFVIQNILGESLDLTGRMILYERIQSLLIERPFWGYGLGNVANVIHPLLRSIHNAQNGALDLYLQIGGVGVVSFFSIYIYVLRKINGKIQMFPVVAYVYMALLISIVEIPFGISSLFVISWAFLCEKDYNEKRTI